MTEITPQIQAMINKYFSTQKHPYRVLEAIIQENIRSGDTVLDIGCGRSAPILSSLKGKAKERSRFRKAALSKSSRKEIAEPMANLLSSPH